MAAFTLGRYRVVSYAEGWKVGEPRTRLTDEGPVDSLAGIRFYPSLQTALEALMDRHLRDADVEGPTALLQALTAFRAELTEKFAIRVET